MLTRLSLLSFALAVQSFAQASPEMTRALERLDKLEKQNQELMAEIQQLRTELQGSAATPPLTERMDVQEARTAELAQAKVETSQRMPISLTGMLLFNAFHNGKNGAIEEPLTARLTPGSAASGATFRQTVLGLKFNGPDLPGGGKASGSFYMDFWGGTASPDNNLLHIRLATIDLAWKNTTITVGQDKPIMAPREPTSLAQVGLAPLTGAGNLWNWEPQARIEQRFHFNDTSGVRVQAGVYQTEEVYPGSAPAAFAASLERWRPAWQGRVLFYKNLEGKRFEIAPGFSFSESHVAGTSVASQVQTLDWLAQPSKYIEITGAAFHGRNAAGLGSLRQSFTVLPSGAVLPVRVNGGWGQVALFPGARLSAHFFGGGEWDRGPSLPGTYVSRNLSYAGNLIYKLAPNVLAALELSQLRTTYVAPGTRLNNHYDLAIAYLF
ncbi:MAG: hypothetical protein M3N54_03830 [Acidobacteriota bacterium]|nr:hypothetical protein [Acidobacteriota bacterium]